MAKKIRTQAPDENYIHDERSLETLNPGYELSYVKIFKSLSRRSKALRRLLAPSRARLNERWVENALVLRSLPPPPARVLDLGGGTSLLPLTLAMLGYDVTLIDLRPCSFRHPGLTSIRGD